ncbi:hypothetical protein [Prosthecobacter sp. SYSU 5D2]|uniref:hypothetical protein n=1 Tax=Prosthecobacter sp. SYSU 5D2 TaxID=3134134 RepID=UPI0031FE4AB3
MNISHTRCRESDQAPNPECPCKGPYFWFNTTTGKLYFRPNQTSVWREVLLGGAEA